MIDFVVAQNNSYSVRRKKESRKTMINPDNSNEQNATQQPVPPPPAAVAPTGGGGGIGNMVRRWKNEDLLKRGSLATRGVGFVSSLLTFLIMACNKHGDWKDFDKYGEYQYVLAIAIISTVYTGLQASKQLHELYSGKQIFPTQSLAMVDFFGDQMMAYLLISAASSAVPLTNRMREGADNIFTDQSAAAIIIQFLAFLSLALSALVSGYKISNQSYI